MRLSRLRTWLLLCIAPMLFWPLSGNAGTTRGMNVAAIDTGNRRAERVLFAFDGTDGAAPNSELIADSSGAFYGVTGDGGTTGNGAVFELTPPPPGRRAWAERVLYSFTGGSDGIGPSGRLLANAAGTLFGTTLEGGANCFCGTVFALTPPAPGRTKWTEQVLHGFGAPGDGTNPQGGLVADAAGSLYGTTMNGGDNGFGSVFELSPPAPGKTAWTEQLIYSFANAPSDGAIPEGGLIFDAGGALYGTTASGQGTVFRLTPPGPGKTAWTETVLHFFSGRDGNSPAGRLLMNASGVLFGTTTLGGVPNGYGNGVAFALAPPPPGQTVWSETVLAIFQKHREGSDPAAGLIAGADGSLYGTTVGGGSVGAGTVFRLVPPGPGRSFWRKLDLYVFGGGADGNAPLAGLIAGANGALYGTTSRGGLTHQGASNDGVVFELDPAP